jgi:hypothetical protein
MRDQDTSDPIHGMHADPDLYLREAAVEMGTALGLIRVMTLLPLFDPALSEVETRLAASWDNLSKARRVLSDHDETDPDRPTNVVPLHDRTQPPVQRDANT